MSVLKKNVNVVPYSEVDVYYNREGLLFENSYELAKKLNLPNLNSLGGKTMYFVFYYNESKHFLIYSLSGLFWTETIKGMVMTYNKVKRVLSRHILEVSAAIDDVIIFPTKRKRKDFLVVDMKTVFGDRLIVFEF